MSNKLPDINTHFSDWYNEIIYQAELADSSPVRGCIVIRPYGYAIWELIKDRLDERIKATGHQNASFPLLIPESFLKREAQHVEGFSPELAVVTYAGGHELEEPLVVRPTSETIIHYMFARWIRSWRDLPLKINQWANVVRWEMRTRPFLRTTEFQWQEGHTAHETEAEAHEEALTMLNEYVDLAHSYLAIPVIAGKKSEQEKFPGADVTYTFEGLMPDGKALQMGTSHMISRNFARAFEMQFQDRNGNMEFPYLTSWGATTRLVGAVVMTHGDEKGLILPPKVAPIQVVIIPIGRTTEDRALVKTFVDTLVLQLHAVGVRSHVDNDDQKTPGAKYYHWELRGVPLRMEVGPRDMNAGTVMLVDRMTGTKSTASHDGLVDIITNTLATIQSALYNRALAKRDAKWYQIDSIEHLNSVLDEKPGMYQAGWCQSAECEKQIKEKARATTRCILDVRTHEHCLVCGKPSISDVLISRAY